MPTAMKWKLGLGIVAALAPMAWADSAIQQAQETLKEQGYYYGQISGDKNADTTAAIRRYQIRNGLQVTGDLNEETIRSLNSNPSSSAKVETATPAPQLNPQHEEPEARPEVPNENSPEQQAPIAPRVLRPPPAQSLPAPQLDVSPNIFAATPYETAPPQLQRHVLLGVEASLRRRGLYRGEMDGAFGPELQFSLRTYQARLGLPASGRLDMDTLASLGLLPGQRGPQPWRRRVAPGPFDEPPVRGEWIH
jgi:peptidoglycan hydrolase-like protein with peptidoglycan-binding domain